MRATAFLAACTATLLSSMQVQAEFSPTNLTGLILWLDANDAGTITKDAANVVSQWNDKSSSNNHAVASGGTLKPLYINRGQVGKPVIHFDGTDALALTYPVAMTTNHTAFFTAKLQGTTARSVLADAGLNKGWTYGYGGAGILYTLAGYTFADEWRVDSTNSSSFDAGTFHIFQGYDCPYTGTANALKVGGNHGAAKKLYGCIGELLVYDNDITGSDRQDLEEYLYEKWIDPPGGYPPSATDDAVGAAWDVSITINVLGNDDGTPSLGLSSVTQPTNAAGQQDGSAIITNSSAAVHFDPQSGESGRYYFQYVVTNGLGTCTGQVDLTVWRPVAFNPSLNVTSATLSLWFDADDATTITKDGGNAVSKWDDKSVGANDATATGSECPLYVEEGQNGNAVILFDGDDDALALDSMFTTTGDEHIFFVAKPEGGDLRGMMSDPGVNRGWSYGLGGTGTLYTVAQWTFATSWSVDGVDGTIFDASTYHILEGTNNPYGGNAHNMKIGGDYGAIQELLGCMAEILVYDDDLVGSERQAVLNYLNRKWFVAPTLGTVFVFQ